MKIEVVKFIIQVTIVCRVINLTTIKFNVSYIFKTH